MYDVPVGTDHSGGLFSAARDFLAPRTIKKYLSTFEFIFSLFIFSLEVISHSRFQKPALSPFFGEKKL